MTIGYDVHHAYIVLITYGSRFLNVSVFGFYDHDCKFQHGIKEMPLIGSECRLLSRDEFEKLHQLSDKNELSVHLGTLIDEETQNIFISVKKRVTLRLQYLFFK